MVLIKDSAIGSDRQKIKLFYSEKSGSTESEILQIIRLLHMNYISVNKNIPEMGFLSSFPR
jgi:hypothetical protein